MQMMNFVPVQHFPHSNLDNQLRWTSIDNRVVAFRVSDSGTVATVGGQPATLPTEVEQIKNVNALYMLARTQLIQTSPVDEGGWTVHFLGIDYVKRHRPYPMGLIDVTNIPNNDSVALAATHPCGALACAADACGALACGALGCAGDACGGLACGAQGGAGGACGAQACGADACAAQACPANACGANACAIDLGLLPCPAEACLVHLGIPFCPFIL